jgi:hypothetical protein
MIRALVLIGLLLAGCGDRVGSEGISGVSPDPNSSESVKPTPSASPSPFASAPTVAFPSRLSLAVGTSDGLVYPQLVDGKPTGTAIRACETQVARLASFGRKLLVVCREPSSRLTIVDVDAGTLSVIPGVAPLEATWSVNGDAVVYTTIGACEPPAPICKTKLMHRELRTGATRQLDERYGVGGDLRTTGAGVMLWRATNMLSFVRSADEVGTWVLSGTTLVRFSQHRLIEGDKGKYLLETEETAFNAGCCTSLIWRVQQEQRLTPSSISNERAVALLDDDRIVGFRPDRDNPFEGSIVIYRAGVVEREGRGKFSPYGAVRDLDWIVGVEYGAGGTLRAYRVSDGAFAAGSGADVTALAFIGPAKQTIP